MSPTVTQSSPLFRLPREIRDLIYEHVLVQDTIHIQCAFTKLSTLSTSESFSSESLRNFKEAWPLDSPKSRRKVWGMPVFDVGRTFVDKQLVMSSTVSMTYQLAKTTSQGLVRRNSIDTRLLQVCKQVYLEATEIFYEKNIFSFTEDFRIPTAFTFLCDRPARSLLLIKALELGLMESNNIQGTAHAHYPVLPRATDSMALQFAYNYFTDLCTLLSTPRMQVQKLYLIIETIKHETDIPPHSLHKCLQWEKEHTNVPLQWVPLWIDPLLKIEGLKVLDIFWTSTQPRFRRVAESVVLMRQRMLVESSTTNSGSTIPRNAILSESLEVSSLAEVESRSGGFAIIINGQVGHVTEHDLNLQPWNLMNLDENHTYEDLQGLEQIATTGLFLRRPHLVTDLLSLEHISYLGHYKLTCA